MPDLTACAERLPSVAGLAWSGDQLMAVGSVFVSAYEPLKSNLLGYRSFVRPEARGSATATALMKLIVQNLNDAYQTGKLRGYRVLRSCSKMTNSTPTSPRLSAKPFTRCWRATSMERRSDSSTSMGLLSQCPQEAMDRAVSEVAGKHSQSAPRGARTRQEKPPTSSAVPLPSAPARSTAAKQRRKPCKDAQHPRR